MIHSVAGVHQAVDEKAQGVLDLSFISLNELVQRTAAIRETVEIPIIVDADTGSGSLWAG